MPRELLYTALDNQVGDLLACCKLCRKNQRVQRVDFKGEFLILAGVEGL